MPWPCCTTNTPRPATRGTTAAGQPGAVNADAPVASTSPTPARTGAARPAPEQPVRGTHRRSLGERISAAATATAEVTVRAATPPTMDLQRLPPPTGATLAVGARQGKLVHLQGQDGRLTATGSSGEPMLVGVAKDAAGRPVVGAITHLGSPHVDAGTRAQLDNFFLAFGRRAPGRPLDVTLFAGDDAMRAAVRHAAQDGKAVLSSAQAFGVPAEGYAVVLDERGKVYCGSRLQTGDTLQMPAFGFFKRAGAVDLAQPGDAFECGELEHLQVPGIVAAGVTGDLVVVAVVKDKGVAKAVGMARMTQGDGLGHFLAKMKHLSTGQLCVQLIGGDEATAREALAAADRLGAWVEFAQAGDSPAACDVAVDRRGTVYCDRIAPADDKR